MYHVEVVTPGDNRTDTSTKSFYQAAFRRHQLAKRGFWAEVRTGSGRLVVDALGEERR